MTANKRRYLALDIEIAKIIPDGEPDWKAYRPLGITCIALAASDWERPQVYSKNTGDGPVPAMSREEVALVVRHMEKLSGQGYTLLTHNGVSFDFQELAYESGLWAECANLALNSVDTCLQILCLKGFPLGLDALAKGMGLSGKTDGINGRSAPVLWSEGRCQEVIAYCAQDAKVTLEVAEKTERLGYLTWISRSGRQNALMLPFGWATAAECLRLPEPDTSWMTSPMKRSDFVSWMTQKVMS